ncbi:MAG: O-methyltransferase [Solirubrobacteraceae bacterium]
MPEDFLSRLAAAERDLLTVVWPAGRNSRVHDGNHFVVAGHRRPVSVSFIEARFLANFVTFLDCRRVVEIGTGFGYSTAWLAMGLSLCTRPERVYTIDNWSEGDLRGHGFQVADELWSITQVQRFIQVITGDSPSAVAQVPPGHADLVFIDGDHRGNQPTLDYEAARQLLSERGRIVFHDANERYDVPAALAAAEADGFSIIPIETSCSPAVATRCDSDEALVNLAVSLASRGIIVCQSNRHQ